MKATFSRDGHEYCLTTEHAASSHGRPVLLSDGELTDVLVEYLADEVRMPAALELLADAAGIWGGPETRRRLEALADEILSGKENPNGADYDRVIAEFQARGEKMLEKELQQ